MVGLGENHLKLKKKKTLTEGNSPYREEKGTKASRKKAEPRSKTGARINRIKGRNSMPLPTPKIKKKNRTPRDSCSQKKSSKSPKRNHGKNRLRAFAMGALHDVYDWRPLYTQKKGGGGKSGKKAERA